VEQVLPRSGVKGGRGEVAQSMYTHVSKCKTDFKKGKERFVNGSLIFYKWNLTVYEITRILNL
jgi:hypothetical protein